MITFKIKNSSFITSIWLMFMTKLSVEFIKQQSNALVAIFYIETCHDWQCLAMKCEMCTSLCICKTEALGKINHRTLHFIYVIPRKMRSAYNIVYGTNSDPSIKAKKELFEAWQVHFSIVFVISKYNFQENLIFINIIIVHAFIRNATLQIILENF